MLLNYNFIIDHNVKVIFIINTLKAKKNINVIKIKYNIKTIKIECKLILKIRLLIIKKIINYFYHFIITFFIHR